MEAKAVKIVAIVNNDVITDYDIEELSKSLCKIDKRFKCGSQEAQQVALFTYVETILKQEHIKSIGVDLKQFNEGYKDYKQKTLSALKFGNKISEQFNTYLYNEYIWEIMISSQIKPEEITEEALQEQAKNKNIKLDDKNRNVLMHEVMQQKANELSKSMMADLKKYYLVEVKR